MGYQLSKEQRMDMVFKGMSPLDPQQVIQYIKTGGRGKTFQEAQERASFLIGEDIFKKKSLGSAHESERDYDEAYGAVGLETKAPKRPTNFREQLGEDMASYGTNAGGVVSSDKLLSLRENIGSVQQQTTKINKSPEEIYKLGYKHCIAYLNAFIINLKNPNTNSRNEVFKALKNVISTEQKLQGSNLLNAYKKGCIKGETEMYNKLKS